MTTLGAATTTLAIAAVSFVVCFVLAYALSGWMRRRKNRTPYEDWPRGETHTWPDEKRKNK
jgi:ABC-type Fe3+ transport system permease subunit